MKKSKDYFIPLGLSLLAGFVYLYTAAPSLLLLDAGDLIAAATSWGVSNPPVPLYLMIGHAFRLLPFGSIIFRFQLLSVILAVASLYLLYQVIGTILTVFTDQKKKPLFSSLQRGLTGIFTIITLAFSYEFWTQAQNTERFLLVCFMEVLVFYLMVICLNKKGSGYLLYLLFFILGLSTGTDPVVISFFPAVLVFLWIKRKVLALRKLLLLGLVGLAGFILVYAYLPIASAHNPFFNYLRPTTIPRIWQAATGQGLNVNDVHSAHVNGFTGSATVFLSSSVHFFSLLWLDFTPFLLPFILLGAIYLWKLHKGFFSIFFSIIITNFILSGIYLSGNQDAWYLLADISFAVFAGFGFLWITGMKFASRPWVRGIFLLCAFIPLGYWWTTVDRHSWNITGDYIQNLYSPIQGPAILFGGGDWFVDTSYYVHDATKEQPKVIPVIDSELYLMRSYRENLALTSDLKIPSDRKMTFDNKAEYSKFVNDFFAMNLQKYKVYITYSALTNNFILTQKNSPSFTLDTNRFQLIPAGLAEQVVLKKNTVIPDLHDFQYQLRNGFPRKKPTFLEASYNSQLVDLTSEYATSYSSLAKYLLQRGKIAQALLYMQKAESFDPHNVAILRQLGSFYMEEKQDETALSYLARARSIQPDNPHVLYDMAQTELQLGNKNEAKKLFHHVIDHSQDDAKMSGNAIDALHSLGEQGNQINNEWRVFADQKMDMAFFYPTRFETRNVSDNLVGLFAPGSDSVIALFYSGQIARNVSLQIFAKTFPYAVKGTLSVSKEQNVDGFEEALTNLYSSDVTSTEVYLLRQGNQAVAVIVPIGKEISSSSDMAEQVNEILQSVTSLDEE